MSGRVGGLAAIVTGCSRGIGASIMRRLCEEGASVLGGDVLDAEGEAGCAALRDSGLAAEYVHLDVTSPEAWDDAVARCRERFGPPAVLVNNAGVVGIAPVHEETLEEWSRIVNVNLTGVFLGMRAVIPGMREQGGGSIVNTSSIWGLVAAEGAAAYHASKGGVTLLTKNAAVTYARDGIRVNSIHPGGVQTTMIEEAQSSPMVRSRTPMDRIASPDEMADAVVFLASGEASFVTGAQLAVDGGYTAL